MNESLRFALDPVRTPDELAREWSQFDEAPGGSFFTRWLCIGTWLETLPGSVEKFVLRAFLGGRLVAMAILVRRSERRHGFVAARQLHFNAAGDPSCDFTIEHNGFASSGIDEARLWAGFLDWFRGAGTLGDELVLPGLTDPGPLPPRPAGLFHRIHSVPAYRVDLARVAAADGDPTVLLSRNSREQLNRAMRRCAEAGTLTIEEAASPEEALAYFAALEPLHVAGWTRRGKSHSFTHPFFARFHRRLIAVGMARAAIQMLRVKAGPTVLGYLYNFRDRGRVFAYQSGFDRADQRRPGYVCHALAIRRNAEKGEHVYDFMAGDNRLKQSFASESYTMSWHTLQRPLLRFRLEQAAREMRALVRR